MASVKGRGISDNRPGRFAREHIEFEPGEEPVASTTQVSATPCNSLITRNQSPDVPFEQSINPYRGCEHGCVYCFARPTHSYLELSPGADFETRIFYKRDASRVLAQELSRDNYVCRTIALGTATDPYQPAEREHQVTRQILEQLSRHAHPVSLITKSSLICRDLDILAPMARQGLASVAISVTTLDKDLKSRLEPRASAGSRRLETVRQLAAAGIPVTVLAAPVIPFINDHEIEDIVQQSADAGACSAGYVVLRLPFEVAPLWRQWLAEHYPDRAERVMQVVQSLHGGRDYRSQFFLRQQGRGQWAQLIGSRFQLAVRRAGLGAEPPRLRTDLFSVPGALHQLSLLPEEEL
jgi:DNA repair photolyase